MKALRAGLAGLLFGLFLGGFVFAFTRRSFPCFLAAASDAVTLIGLCVGVTGGLALVVGGLFGRRGFGVACGLAAAIVAAGFAALYAPTPSVGAVGVAAVAAGALTGFLLARPFFEGRRGRVALFATGSLLIVAGALLPSHRATPSQAPDPQHGKLFVFGLDAGTWTILNELFHDNELPNLRRLREEGSSGELLSDVASLSPRVWTTIATGKLPQKHGVLDFSCCQNEHLKTRRIWEMLQSPDGGSWSVGLFQWLITWPPDAFDPFIVPAWMARGPQTQPPELSFIKEMEIAFQKGDIDHLLHDDDPDRASASRQKAITLLRDWTRAYLEHGLRFSTVLNCVRKLAAVGDVAPQAREKLQYAARRTIQLWINGDVFLELYRNQQPDFSCMIVYGTDNLAHKFWQYHYPDDFSLPREQAAPFAHVLTDYYKAADALLGEILPLLPEQTTLAVVSDHGFSSHGEGGEATQRELRPNLSRLVEMAGAADEVSTALVATHGFVLPKSSDVEAAKKVFDRLYAFFERCVTVDGGKRVFVTKVLETAQLQVDVDLDTALQPATRVATPAGEVAFQQIAAIEERSGNHSVKGVVMLRGPHIRRGHPLTGARLQDVTPTLLYLEGKPIGGDMDGEVLYDAIDPEWVGRAGRAERIESWDPLVPIQRDRSIVGDESLWKDYAKGIGYINGDEKKSDEKKSDPKNPGGKPPSSDGARGHR